MPEDLNSDAAFTPVVILGGGLAGCAAALALADLGICSTIVEARGRLGGRAYSRPMTGAEGPVVEYGGGWAHAGQPRVQALAARLGIGVVPRAGLVRHRYLREGGGQDCPCTATERESYEADMRRWQADAVAQEPEVLGLTLAAYFDHRAMGAAARREILSWWAISGSTAPEQGRVSQLLSPKLAKGWQPKVDELGFTFAGGVQALAMGVARESGAAVILSDPAERLAWGETDVTLRLASGRRIQAKAAIVALPVNTLEQFLFEPALPPAPATVRAKGHVGRAIKFLIRARGVAPGELVTGEARGLRFFWADHQDPDGSTLVVAFALAADMPEPDGRAAQAAFEVAFPGAQVLSVDWHDWIADPFARGTWVGPRAEDEALYAPDHWGPFGRMAFAGSDIAPGADQGWFEGAVVSAERAAQAVAGMLGPRQKGT